MQQLLKSICLPDDDLIRSEHVVEVTFIKRGQFSTQQSSNMTRSHTFKNAIANYMKVRLCGKFSLNPQQSGTLGT